MARPSHHTHLIGRVVWCRRYSRARKTDIGLDPFVRLVGPTCTSPGPRSRDRRAELGLSAMEHAALCVGNDA